MHRFFPPSRHARLAAYLVVALLAPAPAPALIIKSATLTRHPVKGDHFAIKGELEAFDALPLATAAGLVFELEGTIAGLHADAFKRGRTRLTYKAPRGAPGVAQLVVDLKKRRFAAKGTGVQLPNLPGSLTARLVADDVVACAMVPLARLGKIPSKPSRKPKAIRYGLPRGGQSSACLLTGRPSAHPSSVVVDVPTSVTFSAELTAGLALEGDGARVRALDAGGIPSGPALCTLADDGGPASGDLLAGDGLFACTATIEQPVLGALVVAIEATAGGLTLQSPPLSLPIVAALTDADVTAMFVAQDQARDIWDTVEARLGDTLNARLEAIRQIGLLPEVAEVSLSPNGFDIAMRFTSGHEGGLMLSARRGDPNDLAPLSNAAQVLAATGQMPSESGVTLARPAAAARGINNCPAGPERTLIGNRKALILTTSYFGAADDAPIAQAALADSCLPIEVTIQQLTVAALLGIAPYAAVFFSTHGYVDNDGRIVILTNQTASADEVRANGPFADVFDLHELFLIGLPKKLTGGNRNVWVVRPLFLRRIQGTLDNGLVHASHCHSADDPAEAAAFRAKGARTFFGFKGVVSYNFARRVTATLLPDLAQALLTTGDAYARAIKIDPTPFFGDPLGKGLTHTREDLATLHIIGDPRLAYVGRPTLTPPSSTIPLGDSIELTVDVPRKNDCELEHRWSTTIRTGRLADDQGHEGGLFDSTATTVTYETVGDDPDSDDITVLVRAPTKGNSPPPPFFGTACATVEVSGCGDGLVNGSEECDHAADAACPGACLLDCTCRQDPVCGNNIKEPGEICDGTDHAICDAAHPTGNGYCRPNCGGCSVCGDGIVTPNEECDPLDDSPCPNACRLDCTCGCAPGDSSGCPASQCCDPQTKDCCAPVRVDSDPACFLVASGCCGGGILRPGFCGPASPGVCPAATDCLTGDFYYCTSCDNKVIDGFCNATTGCD